MERLLKLALLHDLEESITGDLTPEDKASKGEAVVVAQKLSAREKILSTFPKDSRRAYRELWSELDTEKSREAKLVRELDKLEMALQAHEYSKRGIDSVRLREFHNTAKAAITDAEIRGILEESQNRRRN